MKKAKNVKELRTLARVKDSIKFRDSDGNKRSVAGEARRRLRSNDLIDSKSSDTKVAKEGKRRTRGWDQVRKRVKRSGGTSTDY